MADQPANKNTDTTIGIHKRQDGQLRLDGKTLTDTEYKITPSLEVLIMLKHPRPTQYNSNDYKTYKSLVAQTKVKPFPNRTGTTPPHVTWKWRHMFRKMVIPGERIAEEESEDTYDADSVESYPDIALIGDIGESSDISSPGILSPDTSGIPYSILALMEKVNRR